MFGRRLRGVHHGFVVKRRERSGAARRARRRLWLR